MSPDRLKEYYEEDADRFWNAAEGMRGRDLDVYPLLEGGQGRLIEFGSGSGSLLLGLARETRFTECIGVDISAKALKATAEAWDKITSPYKAPLKLMSPTSDLI